MGLVNVDFFRIDLLKFDRFGKVMVEHIINSIFYCVCDRDQGEVLAEALKIMLCDDRQHDMQKAAAFVKRLATFSLFFGCAESMAGMVL